MVFADGMTKAGRLVELQYIFARNVGRTYTTADLARKLGVTPRNVRRYLTELSVRGRLPIIRDRRAWRLAPGARLDLRCSTEQPRHGPQPPWSTGEQGASV